MKQLVNAFIAAGLFTSFLTSCNDDDDAQPLVTVQFAQDESLVQENATDKIIELHFDKSSVEDGEVEIAVNPEHAMYFTTNPATVNGKLLLQVHKSQSSVSFSLTPTNDTEINQDRSIEFVLKKAPGNFIIGSKDKFSLTIADDELRSTHSYANFIPANAVISEKYGEGHPIQIRLSECPAIDGIIVIKATSEKAVYGEHYITEPAFVDGELILSGSTGIGVVSFKVIPINNTVITGEFEIQFSIVGTDGNIKKGTKLIETFKISDDELANKPKGYQVGGGSWGLKQMIEYDALGRISKVHIETATPGKAERTETYFYNAAGQLEKINEYPNIDRVFTWENNRIVKSEKINHGVLKSYTVYEYNDLGYVSGTATYYLQPDGQMKIGTLLGYLYFTDGNLYKALTYQPVEGGGEPILLSTRTWDNYIDAENPFPMVDILPTVKTQTKLPSTYRLEENGNDILYNLSYEFRADGLLDKRVVTGTQTHETALYYYY
jgi:hypothetical protein